MTKCGARKEKNVRAKQSDFNLQKKQENLGKNAITFHSFLFIPLNLIGRKKGRMIVEFYLKWRKRASGTNIDKGKKCSDTSINQLIF